MNRNLNTLQGIISIGIGILLQCYAIFNIVRFDEIHIESGVLYIIYPSATDFFVPILIFSVLIGMSGIFVLQNKNIAYEIYYLIFVLQNIYCIFHAVSLGFTLNEIIILILLYIPIFILIYRFKKDYKGLISHIRNIIMKTVGYTILATFSFFYLL
jgi:hypothetical protein